MSRAIITKNLNFGASEAMYEEIKRVAERIHLTQAQVLRLAMSSFLQHGVSYATPPKSTESEVKEYEPSPAT